MRTKKRYSRVIFLCLIACFQLHVTLAQEKKLSYPDSLLAVVKSKVPDTTRIRTYYQLAYYWSDRDTSTAIRYVQTGMKMAAKKPFLLATGYYYLGSCYFDTDIPRAKMFYYKADSLLTQFKTAESFVLRSRCWHNIGALLQHEGDETGFANLLIGKAIPLAEKAGDSVRMARNYISLGLVFTNQLDYQKSVFYLKMAEQILEKQKVTPELEREVLPDLYLKLAHNQLLLKRYADAFPYIRKTRKLMDKEPKSPYLTEYYLVKGMYLARTGQNEAAISAFDSGTAAAQQINREVDIQALNFQKFKTLKDLKRYPEAADVLTSEMKKNSLPDNIPRNHLLELFHMAEIQALMGNYKSAYDWLLRFTEVMDSTKIERAAAEIADLETKYRSTEKEKTILRLQSENEKAALTIRNNRLLNWLFGLVSVFLLIVAIMALLFYRNSRKLLSKQKEVHELELLKLKQEQRILMFTSMLEGQEQERTRLARDLHDGLGGLLSGIKIELSQVDFDGSHPAQQSVVRTIHLLDDAVDELRRIARSIMPELLMKYGLAEATREFCKNLSQSNKTNIVCQVFNYREDFPQEKQIVLYRIIQELVHNAVKHAKAGQILVLLQQRENTLFITVEDDGIGFNVSETSFKNGSGIANIKARTEFLNGTFEIHSSSETGTTITIECPVDQTSNKIAS